MPSTSQNPQRSNRIEVDLKLLQDKNLKALTDMFGDGGTFEKSIAKIDTAIGNLASSLSGAGNITNTSQDETNKVLRKLSNVLEERPSGESGDGSVAPPSQMNQRSRSGGRPPLNSDNSMAAASIAKVNGIQQYGFGTPFIPEYASATIGIGELSKGFLASARYISHSAQSLGYRKVSYVPATIPAGGGQSYQQYLNGSGGVTTAADWVQEQYAGLNEQGIPVNSQGVALTDEEGNPLDAFGNSLQAASQPVFNSPIQKGLAEAGGIIGGAARIGTYASAGASAIIGLARNIINPYSSIVVPAQQIGTGLGYTTAGGGPGGLLSPAAMMGYHSELGALVASDFDLNPFLSTQQAMANQQAIFNYGWGGPGTTGAGNVYDYLTSQLNQYTKQYRGSVTPDQMMQLYDPVFRFGTSSLSQVTQVLQNMGDAASAAHISLSQFSEDLASAASQLSQSSTSGMDIASAASALQAYSEVTGMAPSQGVSTMASWQNTLLAAGETHSNVWNVTYGKNAGIAQFQAGLSMLPSNLRSPQFWSSIKNDPQKISQSGSQLIMLYNANPNLLGGMNPKQFVNFMLRGGNPIARMEALKQVGTTTTMSGFENLLKMGGATGQEQKDFSSDMDKFLTKQQISDKLDKAIGKKVPTAAAQQAARLTAEKSYVNRLLGHVNQTKAAKAAGATQKVTVGLTPAAAKIFQIMANNTQSLSTSNSNKLFSKAASDITTVAKDAAIGAAIGTAIPIPGVGTGLGALAGAGYGVMEDLGGILMANLVLQGTSDPIPIESYLYFKYPKSVSGNPLYIRSGATSITWDYQLNYTSTSTIGGEVIQILSCFVGPITISGITAGFPTGEDKTNNHPGYGPGSYTSVSELRDIIIWFLKYMSKSGTLSAAQQYRNEGAIQFKYPARGWDFFIQVTDLGPYEVDSQTYAIPWSITGEIVSDNALDYFQAATMSSFTDSITQNPDLWTAVSPGWQLSANPFINPAIDPNGSFAANNQALASQFQDSFTQLISAWAGGDLSSLFLGNQGTTNSQQLETAVAQDLNTVIGNTTGTGGASSSGSGTIGVSGQVTNLPAGTNQTVAQQIVTAFNSAHGATFAILGLAIALQESNVNPDAWNYDGISGHKPAVGLFQNIDRASNIQVTAAQNAVVENHSGGGSGDDPAVSQNYPIMDQISDAISWIWSYHQQLTTFYPGGVDINNVTTPQYAQWAELAQGSGSYALPDNPVSQTSMITPQFQTHLSEAQNSVTVGIPSTKALQIAQSQLGVTESPPGSNEGPQVDTYLTTAGASYPNPWCAAFIYWCFQQAFGSNNPLPRSAAVVDIYNAGIQKGWVIPNANPSAGNLVVFNWDGSGRNENSSLPADQYHIGIVSGFSNGTITYISGNNGPASDAVTSSTIALTDPDVVAIMSVS